MPDSIAVEDWQVSPRFAIVGAGKVGTALASLLSQAGYAFVGAASRSLRSAESLTQAVGRGEATADAAFLTSRADLVFITTPDDAIKPVCDNLAARGAFRAGSIVAHCSGAHSSALLESARAGGAHVASLHPLQTFATVEQATGTLAGSYCCIEGDAEAVRVLQDVARAIRAKVMVIPTGAKVLYHAAAVVACNYLVALENAALKLDLAAGIDAAQALRSLLPLIKATVSNLERVGVAQSLTGPVARGDVATVRGHLEAIGSHVPHLLPVYKALGREAVEIALARGSLTPEQADQLLGMLH